MKRIHLSSKEKIELERRHAQCSNLKEGDRIKAVLLRSEGWTVPMIAQALRKHESTIIRHLDDYRSGKLSLESGGSESHMSTEQTEALIEHLEAHTYHYVHAIIAYVQAQFGILYSVPGMNKWLHRNNFSYKKPKGHPHKAGPTHEKKYLTKH